MQGGPGRPAFGGDGPRPSGPGRPMQGGPGRPPFGQDGPRAEGGPGRDRRPEGSRREDDRGPGRGGRDQGPRPPRPIRDEPPKRRILGMDAAPARPATPTPPPPPPAAVDEAPTFKRPAPRKAPSAATKRPKPRKLRGGPADDASE